MSNKPLVSVGLPTYNGAQTIRRAIESVLTQDYANIELVISDNGSVDETKDICLAVSEQDSRVKYSRRPTNQGVIENFREVLERSSGEFFLWLGDDDWLDQSYVGRCVEVLLECPDYSLVCGKTRYFYDGKFAYDGVILKLPQERADDRTLAYYTVVSDNGAFYGTMRRAQMCEAPLRSTMGGDWLYVAAVAFMGKVETLTDICLNRSLGGSSANYKKIAETLGLSRFSGSYPRFTIAATAFKDVLISPVYSPCGTVGRFLFGSKVFMLVARREGLYVKRTPREIATDALIRVLPANIVAYIRERRRQRRTKAAEKNA